MPFEKGVVEGGKLFGCFPFLPESRYREKMARGRIQEQDLRAIIEANLGPEDVTNLSPLGELSDIRLARMLHPIWDGTTEELRWAVEVSGSLSFFKEEVPTMHRQRMVESTREWVQRYPEPVIEQRICQLLGLAPEALPTAQEMESWSDAKWQSICLHLLWDTCRLGIRRGNWQGELQPPTDPIRLADWIHQLTGIAVDDMVNELLIPFCASFLDQDLAMEPMPYRADGFLKAFRLVQSQSTWLRPKWIKEALEEISAIGNPLRSIHDSLKTLGISQKESEVFIAHSLLALKGYAGMIWQMESRPGLVARPVPKGSLNQYLAIRLILERHAIMEVARRELDFQGSAHALETLLRTRSPKQEPIEEHLAFEVFQLAQWMGWTPLRLSQASDELWWHLTKEISQFSALERRRHYHLAFERNYRHQTLNALAANTRAQRKKIPVLDPSKESTSFQIVCCIDEREESFRRAMEELDPTCQTFGAAGFFAVAMNYRGAADAHFVPLCPVIIQPRHFIREEVVPEWQPQELSRQKRRRTIGTVTHRIHIGSRTFAGGWMAAVAGSIASFPLVARVLFPRSAARLRRLVGGFVKNPSNTALTLVRREKDPGKQEGALGYSLEEMTDILERLLQDIGLTKGFAPWVVITGHGSSSLNNPHEAAHDCGACGGGRGGPNARVLAQIGNHPEVRKRVRARGLDIPDSTYFVGCYHNTCDESVTFYDLEVIPHAIRQSFNAVAQTIESARRLNAHERCRRFHSASLNLLPEEALRHVEARAEDLAQVRPEYGHATNALCMVGRRDWSKGLFMDRRAFLQSYDPEQDDSQYRILTRILQAVIPVCGGINLEYYFSYVDPEGYGCGTKLPHNITGLVGVMNGALSDLRTGLPWQMVEIHEPVRLLFVVENTPEAILQILDRNPALDQMVRGQWVRMATFDPHKGTIHLFEDGVFRPFETEATDLPQAKDSRTWYRGWRDHLGFARIDNTSIKPCLN